MNLTAKKVFSLSLIVSLLFATLCAGFRAFALLNLYDPFLGYFTTGFFSDVFLPLLYILGAVVFFVFGFTFRTTLSGREYKTTLPSLFASGFAVIATAVWLCTFALDFFAKRLPTAQTLFGILLLVSGAMTVGYFILNALPKRGHSATVILGLGAVLFCLSYAFFAYFDTAFALNSPIKIFDQITFLVFILFFLAETRFRLGMMREAVYFPICMTAVLLSASGSLPGLIYTAIETRPLIQNIMHDFLLFGLFIYALTRQISFLLPAFRLVDVAEGADESPATFEPDGAPAAKSAPDAFAQETFDFDGKRTESEQASVDDAFPEEEADIAIPHDDGRDTL